MTYQAAAALSRLHYIAEPRGLLLVQLSPGFGISLVPNPVPGVQLDTLRLIVGGVVNAYYPCELLVPVDPDLPDHQGGEFFRVTVWTGGLCPHLDQALDKLL